MPSLPWNFPFAPLSGASVRPVPPGSAPFRSSLVCTLAGSNREARSAASVNPTPMLPTHEIPTLTMTVTDALDFAVGYAALVWVYTGADLPAHHSRLQMPLARHPPTRYNERGDG